MAQGIGDASNPDAIAKSATLTADSEQIDAVARAEEREHLGGITTNDDGADRQLGRWVQLASQRIQHCRGAAPAERLFGAITLQARVGIVLANVHETDHAVGSDDATS